jgi:hypothetical protein
VVRGSSALRRGRRCFVEVIAQFEVPHTPPLSSLARQRPGVDFFVDGIEACGAGSGQRGRMRYQPCRLPARGLKGWGDWPHCYSVATRGRWSRGCVVRGSVSEGGLARESEARGFFSRVTEKEMREKPPSGLCRQGGKKGEDICERRVRERELSGEINGMRWVSGERNPRERERACLGNRRVSEKGRDETWRERTGTEGEREY